MEIQQFEVLKHVFHFTRPVYLDHNATTPVSSRVRRKMNQALASHYGNPSSFYYYSETSHDSEISVYDSETSENQRFGRRRL